MHVSLSVTRKIPKSSACPEKAWLAQCLPAACPLSPLCLPASLGHAKMGWDALVRGKGRDALPERRALDNTHDRCGDDGDKTRDNGREERERYSFAHSVKDAEPHTHVWIRKLRLEHLKKHSHLSDPDGGELLLKICGRQPTDPPTDRPTHRPTDPSTDRPHDRPSDRQTDRLTDPPTDPPTGRPTDQPTDPSTGRPTYRRNDRLADAPADPPAV